MRIEEIKAMENKDFSEYLLDYIQRVIDTFQNEVEFLDLTLAETIPQEVEHHIFRFRFNGDKPHSLTEEEIKVLTEDDDSQPHNQYRIYIDEIIIYSTRYL